MEIFIDSADLQEIRRWLEYRVVDGVTTNPSILLKDGGYDMEARAREKLGGLGGSAGKRQSDVVARVAWAYSSKKFCPPCAESPPIVATSARTL